MDTAFVSAPWNDDYVCIKGFPLDAKFILYERK